MHPVVPPQPGPALLVCSPASLTGIVPRLPLQWLASSEEVKVPLALATSTAGTYSLDGFRIAVCAYQLSGSSEVVRLEQPLHCAPPPARPVRVVATRT
jgi:hypothetical protein